MKRSVNIFIGVLAVLFLVMGEQTALCAPRASVDSMEYNAGEVPQGAPITHAFTVKNKGNEPLTIKVKTCSCGGLKFEVPEKPIAAGHSGTVTITIPTKYSKGDYVKEILTETNDPERKELKFTIRATIREVLSVTPRHIVFPPAGKGAEQARVLSVINKGADKVTIMAAVAEPGDIFVVSPRGKTQLEPGQKQVFRVVSHAGDKQAGVQGTLILKTDIKSLGEITVPLVAIAVSTDSTQSK